MSVSIVIPVPPGNPAWLQLADDLAVTPPGTEILFSGPEMPKEAPSRLASLSGGRKVRWVRSRHGRAEQMNAAAREARGDFLWFLPPEARLAEDALIALYSSLSREPLALHFSNIEKTGSAGRLAHWLRVSILKRPGLDHGYCLSRDLFDRLGGFPEEASPGEDLAFLREARSAGIRILCTGGTLAVSKPAHGAPG